MDQAAARSDITSTRTKLFYGLGSVAYGVKDNGFQTILLPFYNQVVHLPPQLVGLALLLAMVCDAVFDPIVGHFSDHLRTRWGRRHPLMYASALPVAVSYLLLWNPPHWSQGALFAYLVVVAIVTRTFITFYEIPSSALVPELTDDYDQRTSFISYRVLFGWAGGLTMLALAFAVFLRPDATQKYGQLNATGYSHYGMLAALVMFVAILVSAAGTHRFIPQFRVPPKESKTLGRYVREMFATLSNRAFLILILSGVFFNMAVGLVFALNLYVNTYFWMFNSIQLFYLVLATFVSVIFAFIVSPAISARQGKKQSSILMFMFGFVISMMPLGLRYLGLFPANFSPALLPALWGFTAVSGIFTIGASIMIISMLADVVEASEIKTGRRSEGLFFAGSAFMQKVVSGFGLLASGMVLAAAGFPNDAVPGKVDPAIVDRFILIYVPLVVVLFLVGFAIMWFFPITRESHRETLRTLAAEVGEAQEPS
ncbi:MAG: MFS transporter [Alphaproteobacteria bacterium]|nr:MFS transporter [Alphaproteobacteria bacterium]